MKSSSNITADLMSKLKKETGASFENEALAFSITQKEVENIITNCINVSQDSFEEVKPKEEKLISFCVINYHHDFLKLGFRLYIQNKELLLFDKKLFWIRTGEFPYTLQVFPQKENLRIITCLESDLIKKGIDINKLYIV